MASEEKKVIDFITHIPKDTNPYPAVARMIGKMIKTPPPKRWSSILTRVTLGVYVLMFMQALFLLYQRIRAKKFGALKFNEVGLLVINASDAMASFLCVYAALTIAFLTEQIALEYQLVDESALLLVFGYKFLVVLTCSWAFVWVCTCSCASLLMKSGWGTKRNTERLRATLRWGTYGFFVVIVVVPFPLVIWFYTTAYEEFCTMRSIIHQVQKALMAASAQYDPKTDSQIKLLAMLMPARQVFPHWRNMEHNILNGIRVYGASLGVLVLLYNPMLFFSLRQLYKAPISADDLAAALGHNARGVKMRISQKARRERRSLVYHSLAIYCSTLIHLPLIVWQLFHSPEGFSKDPMWAQVTYHGLAAPFSVTGNIMLLILNIHGRRLVRDTKKSNKTYSASPSRPEGGTLWRKNASSNCAVPNGARYDGVALHNMLEKQIVAHFASDSNTITRPPNSKSTKTHESKGSWESETLCPGYELNEKIETIHISHAI